MTTDWVKIATFATGLEADMARTAIEEAGIPVLVRGNQIGLFGAGFQGLHLGGIQLHVPASAAHAARDLIDIDSPERESE